MNAFKQIVGVILILIAAIVAIHTVIEPVYHTSTEEKPYNTSIWSIINPLSAIAIILGLIFGYCRMSRAGENSSGPEFIAANTLFYGFLFAAILFFWNWFGISGVGKEFTAVSADVRSLVWIFFDALFPLLSGAMGVHLLRSSASE